MLPGGFPTIQLTLQRMEVSILHALSQYEADISTDIEAAVKAYCEPANIQRVIDEQVGRAIDTAIRSEVNDYFSHGPGRGRVREAVRKSLEDPYGTP